MIANHAPASRTAQVVIFLIAIACLAPSLAVNVAHTAASSVPLALAGGMSVVLAAIAVMAAERAARQRNVVLLAVTTLTAVICITYNLTAALGAASHGRAIKQAEGDTRQQLHQIEARRAALPVTKPAAAIEAELNGLRQQPAWTSTKGCVDATLPASRTFCTGYADVQAKLAVARQAEQLDADIARLRARPMIGDAQGENIAALLQHAGISATPSGVGLMLNTLLAVLVEVIAAFGPAVVVAAFRSDPQAVAVEAAPAPAKRQPKKKAPAKPRKASRKASPKASSAGNVLQLNEASAQRQRRIAELRLQGKTQVQIAAELGISRATVQRLSASCKAS